MLHSTIYNNIKIAKPDATDEEIYNAAKKAELHNFIESLEYKYDTIICIAHRLSTLKDMDNILVIEKGKIVDYGTPDYIIPKYDNEEFMAEESYLAI